MQMLESREHLLLRLIDPFFFWTLHWSSALERWRSKAGMPAGRWLAVVAEMEALCALAGYSYEHPADPFAEFTVTAPYFEVEGLAHPLLL